MTTPRPSMPETPHDLPYDRTKVDTLLDRVRRGERIRLIDELLACVDWRAAFGTDDGHPVDLGHIATLMAYYREKFSDIGPIFIAELLSTEFMTEQRAQGDIVFSERLITLGTTEPDLWAEITRFFRRKELATAMLVLAHDELTDDEVEARQTAWSPAPED